MGRSTIDFNDLFPLATYDHLVKRDYAQHCRFFFGHDPDNLDACLTFIKQKKDGILRDNAYAYKMALKNNRLTVDGCKDYAQTNDTAFRICSENIEKKPDTMESFKFPNTTSRGFPPLGGPVPWSVWVPIVLWSLIVLLLIWSRRRRTR